MAQSEDTIRRRIDALGLTEPFVAPYGQGDNEIIVELPGEGDPNRAKSVIQAGGQLELAQSRGSQSVSVGGGRAWPRMAAFCRQARRLVPSKTTDASGQGSLYLVDRLPIITGRDLRSATAAAQHRQSRILRSGVHAFDRCGAPFRSLYRAEYRPPHGHRSGSQGGVGAGDSEPHRRLRTHHRAFRPAGSQRSGAGAARRSASRIHPLSRGTHGGAVARRRFDPPWRTGFDGQPAGRADLYGCSITGFPA